MFSPERFAVMYTPEKFSLMYTPARFCINEKQKPTFYEE